MALPAYYSTQDLCSALSVTARTLHRWSNSETTPFNEPLPKPVRTARGSSNRYSAKEIEAWIKNNIENSHLVA